MWILESSYWCVWRLKRCGFVVRKPAGGRLWGFKSYPYKTPNLYSLFLFVVWDVSSHLFLLPCFCLAIWILTLWNFNPLINTSVSSVWFFLKKHIFLKKIVCTSVYLHVSMCTKYMLGPTEARREHGIPWS